MLVTVVFRDGKKGKRVKQRVISWPGQISHNSGSVDVVNSQQRITPR